MASAADVATLFVQARVSNRRVDALPMSDDSEAFGQAVQDVQLSAACTVAPYGRHCGWKIGATNAGAQAAMGFGPFYGPLFEGSVHENGATLSLSNLGATFKASEAEFAFFMGQDLVPSEEAAFTEEQCYAAVSHVVPAIELAASRLAPHLKPTPAAVLSDCTFNGAVILADTEARVARSALRPEALPTAGAALVLQAETVASSTGANVLDSPLKALCWLANALRERRQHHLRKGDVIMTGAAAAHKALLPGQTLEAHFAGLTNDAQPLIVRVHIAA